MGNRDASAFSVPSWTVDAGSLKEEGAEVRASCTKCKAWRLVNLDRVIAERGERFSFWNRTPPCDQPDCPGKVHFLAIRRGAAVWPTMMFERPADMVAPLHARWRASWPAAKRDRLPVLPLLRAVRGRLMVRCQCERAVDFELDHDAVRSWAHAAQLPAITTAQVTTIFRTQCDPRRCKLIFDLVEGSTPGDRAE